MVRKRTLPGEYRMKHARIATLLLAAACMAAASAGLSDLSTWSPGRSMRASSNSWVPGDMYAGRNNADNIRTVTAGHSFTLADLQGPGVIHHIWLTFIMEPHRWAPNGAAEPAGPCAGTYYGE